jgi:hypothetical protein
MHRAGFFLAEPSWLLFALLLLCFLLLLLLLRAFWKKKAGSRGRRRAGRFTLSGDAKDDENSMADVEDDGMADVEDDGMEDVEDAQQTSKKRLFDGSGPLGSPLKNREHVSNRVIRCYNDWLRMYKEAFSNKNAGGTTGVETYVNSDEKQKFEKFTKIQAVATAVAEYDATKNGNVRFTDGERTVTQPYLFWKRRWEVTNELSAKPNVDGLELDQIIQNYYPYVSNRTWPPLSGATHPGPGR